MGWDNRQMDLPQYERQSDMDTYHHLTIREHEDRIVADFTKQPILDAWTAKELGDELRDVAGRADCRNLILNFSDVKWLASAVLEKLVVVRSVFGVQGRERYLGGRRARDSGNTRLDETGPGFQRPQHRGGYFTIVEQSPLQV